MKTPLKTLGILFTLLFISNISLAQDNHNVTDLDGLKQGLWIVFGIDRPGQGWADDGLVEEGHYKDDRKEGLWVKYHKDGKTARLNANYVDGHPNGDYKKFNKKGLLIQQASFVEGNLIGPQVIYDDNGMIQSERVFDENGEIIGTDTHYYPNGQIQYQVNYENGKKVGKAVRYWENGDIKQVIIYDENGEIKSKEEVEPINPMNTVVENTQGGPDGSGGLFLDGSVFQSNGYNKMYLENRELWMAGIFKDSRLWDGEEYVYDENGLLERIKVWKKGKYISDGQID